MMAHETRFKYFYSKSQWHGNPEGNEYKIINDKI